jgi:hypothetical protein
MFGIQKTEQAASRALATNRTFKKMKDWLMFSMNH